jgi:two-component system, OmpR family, phosphate regulon sensor histidine kinase PhoR
MSATGYLRATGMARGADLQQASDFQAVLLGMAGHDLRQPLQVIRTAHERLGIGFRSQCEQDLLQKGQLAIDRLVTQLDQLLDALRLYEHLRCAEVSQVALEPLFSQLRNESEESALEKGIAIRVCSTKASVMSNAVLLKGILRNLVSNAIKYTDPQGEVLIGCRRSDQNVRIDVCDTGIGLTEEQLPRIFEAFGREDYARCEGLGIGLFIVRRAAEVLGHDIGISSVTARGSRFSVFAARAH